MRTMLRGIRSVLRHPLRSALVAALLALGVGMTLSMLVVDAAVNDRIDELKSQFGTDIQVRPAGVFGGFTTSSGPGGIVGTTGESTAGEPGSFSPPTVSEEVLDQIEALDGVRAVERRAQAQYSGDELESSFTPPPGAMVVGGGSLPIPVFASSAEAPTIPGGGTPEIIDGAFFGADESDANVAVVGRNLAEKNALSVGSTFEMEGTTIEVVGIYDAGQEFGNNALFLPYDTLLRLFELEGASEARVITDSADNVEAVADDIRDAVGEDVVDVVTATDQVATFSGYLNQAAQDSGTGLYAALIGSALIIIVAVGLAARQRVREMGILKALGASHWNVIGQFSVETLVLSIVAALLGELLTFPIAQRVSNTVVDAPAGPGGAVRGVVVGSGQAVTGVPGSELAVSVGSEVFAYALVLAVALALLASIVTTWYVVRVKPMEVLRGGA